MLALFGFGCLAAMILLGTWAHDKSNDPWVPDGRRRIMRWVAYTSLPMACLALAIGVTSIGMV